MKASELVKQLNELIEKHGDQVVTMAADVDSTEEYGDEAPVFGVARFEDDNGKITRFQICDYEGIMAFT